MLKENILRQIMVRSISKVDSFASSSDQVDIVSGIVLSNLTCFNTFQPFSNRLCCIRWIPKRPNSLLVGGKHGELCLIPDVNRYTISGNDVKNLDMISEGIGPGGEIREIIPDVTDNRNFYSLNVSGELVKVDMSTHDINVLQPQGDFNVWYAGLNVNFDKRVIMLGDNKGNVHMLPDSTRSGEGERTKIKCHKPGKINHIDFHPRDSNIMSTAATADMCVKLWDIRMLDDFRELEVLPHNRGVNSCYFNRTGHKMVTTDQENELRIYSSGDWSHIATIIHPHRHFQFITNIRAEWHPLTDLIAVGNFPKLMNETKLVNFFDGRDGREIMVLENPNNKICSLNRFNYTGDILASMYQTEIVIWKQKGSPDEKAYKKKILRFRRNRRSNQSDSDNDSDNDKDSGSDSGSDSSGDDDDDLGKTKGKGRGKGKSQTKSQGKSQEKSQGKVQGKGTKKVQKAVTKTKKTPPKKETRKLPPRNAKRKS